jgi:hypothetical protein
MAGRNLAAGVRPGAVGRPGRREETLSLPEHPRGEPGGGRGGVRRPRRSLVLTEEREGVAQRPGEVPVFVGRRALARGEQVRQAALDALENGFRGGVLDGRVAEGQGAHHRLEDGPPGPGQLLRAGVFVRRLVRACDDLVVQ